MADGTSGAAAEAESEPERRLIHPLIALSDHPLRHGRTHPQPPCAPFIPITTRRRFTPTASTAPTQWVVQVQSGGQRYHRSVPLASPALSAISCRSTQASPTFQPDLRNRLTQVCVSMERAKKETRAIRNQRVGEAERSSITGPNMPADKPRANQRPELCHSQLPLARRRASGNRSNCACHTSSGRNAAKEQQADGQRSALRLPRPPPLQSSIHAPRRPFWPRSATSRPQAT